MKLHFVVLAILALSLVTSCKKVKNNNKKPVITYLGLDSNTVVSGSSEDTVYVHFQVTDGDGDIAHGQSEHDIYMTDSRTGQKLEFFYPEIPEGTINTDEGVNATVTVKIVAALFLETRLDHPNGDTLTYDLYVKDRASNQSNTVTTSKIYIKMP